MEIIYLLRTILVEWFGLFIAFIFAGVFLYLVLRKLHSTWLTVTLVTVFLGVSIFFYAPHGLPRGLEYPFFLKTYGPVEGPVLSLGNVLKFFSNFNSFERVENIARNPNDVPSPITRTEPELVKVELTTKEVIAEMAPGVFINYWTFDGQVPGPMIRVREGDTVELTLHNDPTSLHHHNIDLHAVTGPGGGAVSTMVAPGESATVTFKALHPGLFVYHCATPNVANHMTHGMYGLILVEPEEGLPSVDHEYYVMQGEFYTTGGMGRKGIQLFDAEAMLAGQPTYMVFNGKTGGLGESMQMQTGETARIYMGNGGVNLISSFHVIGEVFDKVFPEGSITSEPHTDVQTTLVPAGGATVVEFDTQVPGKYILVDHALSRVDRGLWGVLKVSGEENKAIYDGKVIEGQGH
ncbi:MAG: hypothetical protein QG636_217 [Patescibacteria group bacterium]|nr:hypothetical protein [Patescibacteria group bacterium]